MNVAAVCKVCEEAFNCVDRKPLVLPCGHTYCLACLTAIETSGDKLCPACRESWSCVACKLPIAYMLIPGSNAETKHVEKDVEPDYVCCLHSCPLEYWCCECQVATCKKCVSGDHFAHGNIVFEKIFENRDETDMKLKFVTEIESKILPCIKKSTKICDEGLELMKSIKKTERTLQAWKQRLLTQEIHSNSFLQAFKSESDSSVKSEMESFAKQISHVNIEQLSLSKQFEETSAQFYDIGTAIEAVHENLKTLDFLPQKLPANASNWTIDDQCKAQMALNSVKNRTAVPDSVTLISTKSSPIVSLPELLLELCKAQFRINLQLLDSFLHGVSSDDDKLEIPMLPEYGKCLDSFYGHVRHSSTWSKLGVQKLNSLGLRLDTGAGVAGLYKIVEATSATWIDISISKKVVVADILVTIPRRDDLRCHFVGLSDNDRSWCSQVLQKLVPATRCNQYRHRELWLHECTLSKASIQALVSGIINTSYFNIVRLQLQGLTEADQQFLQQYSRQHGVILIFKIPPF
ncbi:Zinc finger RING-type [Trinorchestia longiramus]|nr:Zinc finger RING-type [Trinorchestia longiramus]